VNAVPGVFQRKDAKDRKDAKGLRCVIQKSILCDYHRVAEPGSRGSSGDQANKIGGQELV